MSVKVAVGFLSASPRAGAHDDDLGGGDASGQPLHGGLVCNVCFVNGFLRVNIRRQGRMSRFPQAFRQGFSQIPCSQNENDAGILTQKAGHESLRRCLSSISISAREISSGHVILGLGS